MATNCTTRKRTTKVRSPRLDVTAIQECVIPPPPPTPSSLRSPTSSLSLSPSLGPRGLFCFPYINRNRVVSPHFTKKEREQTGIDVCYELQQGWCLDRLLGDAHVTRRNDCERTPDRTRVNGSGAVEALVRPFGPVGIPRACALKVASERRKKLRVYGRLRHEACMP